MCTAHEYKVRGIWLERCPLCGRLNWNRAAAEEEIEIWRLRLRRTLRPAAQLQPRRINAFAERLAADPVVCGRCLKLAPPPLPVATARPLPPVKLAA